MSRKKPPLNPLEVASNVTVIPTVKSVHPAPVVLYLQDMLEKARSGEVTAIMGVVFDAGEAASYFSVGVDSEAEVFTAVGVLRFAEMSLLKDFVDGVD